MDAKHEVALAYQVTTANAADCKSLPDLVEQGQANLPEGRIETLAYDKAADDNESHRLLNKAGIRPVIQNRRLWKDQTEQMLPGHDGRSNIVYDEAGTVYCYDRTSQPIVRQKMAYIGYEPQRETIKYRCPARHEGWPCPHDAVCNAGKSYGKTVPATAWSISSAASKRCECSANRSKSWMRRPLPGPWALRELPIG